MSNLLVAVDRSLEASFALRTACLFGIETRIRPMYVFDPPGRDMSFGAGWARKSWERETREQAGSDIGDLLQSERNQCSNIEDPIIRMGEPVQELSEYFWEQSQDILVIGAPFRGIGPLALAQRFMQAAKKARRDLPLLIVRQFKEIRRVTVLTDGGESAEHALGVLVRANASLHMEITLIGLSGEPAGTPESEALHLERGLAILKEKGIDAGGHAASELMPAKVTSLLKSSDLVVGPYLRHRRHAHLYDLMDHDLQAVLVYIGRN